MAVVEWSRSDVNDLDLLKFTFCGSFVKKMLNWTDLNFEFYYHILRILYAIK